MRDIFAEIFADETKSPMEAARRAMRPPLRQRFYRHAAVGEGPEGFAVLLDGKPVRTPARRILAAPVRPLAEAIAAEWEAQREVIDPKMMPLTRLANSIIDGVADSAGPVAAEICKFLASDLLFYRAEGPEGLRSCQELQWNPLLEWAQEVFGARFVLAEGVRHVQQPEAALANAASAIPKDAWRLGALHCVTALTGSALLALALMHERLSVEKTWAAAHADEDFQIEQWGRDEIALEQRAFRFKDLQAAATVLAHLKS